MAEGDKYFDCTKAPSLEQAMRLMFVEDVNDGPILKNPLTHPLISGLASVSETAPFPEIMYNFDAGVQHANDESPVFEVYATSDTLEHAGESFTVHVPAHLEILSIIDNTWHSTDFSHFLGDGLLSDTTSWLKCRLRNGFSVGTYSDAISVSHPEFATDPYTVLTVAGRVTTATHAKVITWQSALTGAKPSGKLLYNWNNLITGIDADGDLVEMDYFQMIRGMETQEQRLKPVQSTAGADADLVGSGAAANVFNQTGIKCTAATQKGMRIKWKPITNGVKATQNNNSLFVTFSGSTTAAGFYAGINGAGGVNWTLGKNSGVNMGNTRSWTSGFSSNSVHTANAFFGVRRTSSTAYESYINGTTSAANTNTSAAVADVYLRMPGVANNSDTGDMLTPHTVALLHCIGMGSNAVNFTDVRARLNTYYTALGFDTT